MNTLFYGDNLPVLREHIADESVDLIYLDPPFNSNASYNVLFSDRGGSRSAAQLQAFKDTWSWPEAAQTYQELILQDSPIADALVAFGKLLPEGGLLAYLVMMAPRLAELHRVLKPTGSLYLHCDPTASHYLKVVMDAIFGVQMYRSEIIWKRSASHGGPVSYNDIHDVILYYSKGDAPVWTAPRGPYDPSYIDSHYSSMDPDGRRYQLVSAHGAGPGPARTFGGRLLNPPAGRHWMSQEHIDSMTAAGKVVFTRSGMPRYKRYLDEAEGPPLGTVWTDINPINSQAAERLGYPTQKPLALLERIIQASSNEGDVVLDPFCGCGTAVHAAQALGRRWIGIDITWAAIHTIRERLAGAFEDLEYEVIGAPTTVADAARLAEEDPYQFQWWITSLVGARPAEHKKGADHGIDGRLIFSDGVTRQEVILSVKAGHVTSAHVDQLHGVVEKEKAAMGALLTMQPPTGPMRATAAKAGVYESPWGKHPRIQILTAEELLSGATLDMPPIGQVNLTYQRANRATKKEGTQGELL